MENKNNDWPTTIISLCKELLLFQLERDLTSAGSQMITHYSMEEEHLVRDF